MSSSCTPRFMEWLEQNRTKVFDYPLKIAVFGLGAVFLTHIGIPLDCVSGGFLEVFLERELTAKKNEYRHS